MQPEDSRNFSAGFVYTPKWIHNWNASSTLTLSVDFWYVQRTGVVTTPSGQSLVTEFFRTPLGGLPPGTAVQIDPATNTANFVQSGFENSGRQIADGIDMSLQYQYQTTNWGTFTWSNDWTYLNSFLFQLNGAAPTHEVSGRANNDNFEGAFFGQVTAGDGWLKWKGISRLTWDYNNFSLTTAARYFDGFREQRNTHLHVGRGSGLAAGRATGASLSTGSGPSGSGMVRRPTTWSSLSQWNSIRWRATPRTAKR